MMQQIALNAPVLAFLERNRIATLNLAGILRNEPDWALFVDDAEHPLGVLVKGPWFWYVHSEDEAFLEALFREVDQNAGFHRFSGVWRPLAERIKARYPLVWDAPCDLYHLPPENHRPELAQRAARAVDLRDAEIIDEHYAYRHSGSLENIRSCIRDRNSSAIYVDGQPVCWLLVHEDDSLGIMYTLEEHRRRGYAVDVTVDLVTKQLAAGRTPFLQIRDDNGLSPGLARKCGFERHGSCDWFGIVSGTPPELVEGGRTFWRRLHPGDPAPECLCRFLHALPSAPEAAETIGEREWLAFASLQFEEGALRRSLAGQEGSWRLLCLRHEGRIRATAALLLDDDDGGELAWCTSRDEAFLRSVLQAAKAMGMAVLFTHAAREEQAVFEALGFRLIERVPG